MSSPYGDACPIWGYDVQQSPEIVQEGGDRIVRCYRAGGRYRITPETEALVATQPESVKARLTTILIDKHVQGVEIPEVTVAMVQEAERKKPLAVLDRTDRLLQYFYFEAANAVRTFEDVHELVDYTLLSPYGDSQLAWSESISREAIAQIFGTLISKGFLKEQTTEGLDAYGLTFDGILYSESSKTTPQTAQAFIAMWFDPSMDGVYENGIRPAIEAAGYTPLRIDQKEHNNKIDDEIIAEIRRSRFVVADFTHGDDGVRGSVYYEAGFAYGLDIPVIYLSREGSDLAFDTRQYAHIMWKDTDELSDQLQNRILAVIGEGPNIVESP